MTTTKTKKPSKTKTHRPKTKATAATADTTPAVKKLSALGAAARVLAETGTAMSCKELIAAMAEKGYWTTPGGRTPHATLYAAILREITTQGKAARFQKTAPGHFIATGQATAADTPESAPAPARTKAAKKSGKAKRAKSTDPATNPTETDGSSSTGEPGSV